MSREKPYRSSLLRRLQPVTHALTLDLYFRRGAFWDGIKAVREAWELGDAVPPAVPPRLTFLGTPLDGTGHVPEIARQPFDHDELVSRGWKAHHAFVDRWSARFPQSDDQFPLVFLGGCIFYDPPADNLIDFANHADNLAGNWRPELSEGDPPLGLPLVWVPDLHALGQVSFDWGSYIEQQFMYDLKATLIQVLDDRGFDGRAIWSEAERRTVGCEESGEPDRTLPTDFPLEEPAAEVDIWNESMPVIEVRPETTDADIRASVAWIRQQYASTAERPSKPTRDPLVSVQCAIWRDDFDWSEKRIGDHFGWTIQYPPGVKPRCETARQHIADGRALRQHKS